MQNIHTSSFLLMLQSLNFPMVTFCNYNALKNFSVQGNKNNNLTAFVQGQHNWSKTVYIFDLSFHNIAEQLGEKAKQKSLTQNLCDDKFRVFRITPQLNCIQSFVSLSTLFCLVMMSSWIRHLDSLFDCFRTSGRSQIIFSARRSKYFYQEVLLFSQLEQMSTIPESIPHPSRRLKVLQQPTLQTRSGEMITLKIQTNLILSFCEEKKWQRIQQEKMYKFLPYWVISLMKWCYPALTGVCRVGR